MKPSLVLLAGVAMLGGIAFAEPSADPFDRTLRAIPTDQTMSAGEVTHYALPYKGRVGACYAQHARSARDATGQIAIYVVISREGRVVYHEVTADGVGGVRRARIDRCLSRELATWRFPPHTGFTNAVVAYVFWIERAELLRRGT